MKIKHTIFGLIIGVSMAIAGSIGAVVVFGPNGVIDMPKPVAPQAEDSPITDDMTITPPIVSTPAISAQEARLRSIEARLTALEEKTR